MEPCLGLSLVMPLGEAPSGGKHGNKWSRRVPAGAMCPQGLSVVPAWLFPLDPCGSGTSMAPLAYLENPAMTFSCKQEKGGSSHQAHPVTAPTVSAGWLLLYIFSDLLTSHFLCFLKIQNTVCCQHESEILPFPNPERNFVLPEEIIQEVREGETRLRSALGIEKARPGPGWGGQGPPGRYKGPA